MWRNGIRDWLKPGCRKDVWVRIPSPVLYKRKDKMLQTYFMDNSGVIWFVTYFGDSKVVIADRDGEEPSGGFPIDLLEKIIAFAHNPVRG